MKLRFSSTPERYVKFLFSDGASGFTPLGESPQGGEYTHRLKIDTFSNGVYILGMRNFYLIEPSQWLFSGTSDVRYAATRAEIWFQEHGSYAGAERQIEEFVRQWVLAELLDQYNYPREWLEKRISIEERVRIGSSEREADIAIKNDAGRPFLFIETKAQSAGQGVLDAERQVESYLSATHTATIGMATDGFTTKVIRKKIDPNDFEYIRDIPSYEVRQLRQANKLIWNPDDVQIKSGKGKTGLTPLNERYEQLLFNCHSVIRDNDGLHADEALDEICKLLYAKIYDETETVDSGGEKAFRFQTYGAANSSEVASNIRVLYQDARESDIRKYAQRTENYARSRGVFRKEITLSDFAVYRIVEILQDYSIRDSSTDVKGRAFQKLLAPAVRAGMGQYFTPDPIVQLAVELIQPQLSDLILDPFCGSGHFLTSALRYVERNSPTASEKSLYEFKFFHLHGIEKSDRMVRIAMTDMMLHDDGRTNIRNVDALLPFSNYPDIKSINAEAEVTEDGLEVFDVVLTNPPFGSTVSQESLNHLGNFALARGRKKTPVEYLGLERAVQFLKPGGKLAIVLPEHIFKGKTTSSVRDWIASQVDVKAIFSFPEEAFAPFGALVKTCLLIAEKPISKRPTQGGEEEIFLCEISNLGYDATGRFKRGSEIADAAEKFKQFMKKKR